MDETRAPRGGLAPSDVARQVQRQASDRIAWARRRKKRFNRSASAIRVLSLALAVASTVILGLQHLNSWASVAFSLVAIGTLVNALEPFFNWRSRWILMEETQYRFHQIEDELEYLLLKAPQSEIKPLIWTSSSAAFKKSGNSPANAGSNTVAAASRDQASG